MKNNNTAASIAAALDLLSNALAEHVINTTADMPANQLAEYQTAANRYVNEIEHATKTLLFWTNRLLKAHQPA